MSFAQRFLSILVSGDERRLADTQSEMLAELWRRGISRADFEDARQQALNVIRLCDERGTVTIRQLPSQRPLSEVSGDIRLDPDASLLELCAYVQRLLEVERASFVDGETATLVALAMSAFDYPRVGSAAKSSAHSKALRGISRDASLSREGRAALIAKALAKRGNIDRDLVVKDLAQSISVNGKYASRLLAARGWRGSRGCRS
jgi:hypothetical protein